jgi:Ca2+-binding EF-hand superfamily protein
VALKFDVDSFESVGLPFLDVKATMHVSLNVGLSLNAVSAINFRATYGDEATPLFNLDNDSDGIITVGELRTLHGASSFGTLFTSSDDADRRVELSKIVRSLDTDDDGILTTTEASAFFAGSYATRAQTADTNSDQVLDAGLAINTGDPDRPVRLLFPELLVKVEIAGSMTISAGSLTLASMLGVFYLELDNTAFKLFASVGVQLGPDIGDSTPQISLDALAVVIIDASGVAADMRSTTNMSQIGISYTNTSGIRLNTTGLDQTVTLPARIIDFVNNSKNSLKTELLNRLHTEQLDLFDPDGDGLITVGDLESLSGRTSWEGLYAVSDSRQTQISLKSIVNKLDTDEDGLLELSEARTFLSDSNDHLATVADRFADGVLTDTRYYLVSGALDPGSSTGAAYAVIEAHGDITINGQLFAAADLRVTGTKDEFSAFVGLNINLGPFGYVKAFGSLKAGTDGVAGMLLADISLGKSANVSAGPFWFR